MVITGVSRRLMIGILLTAWSPDFHKWPNCHHFLESVNHDCMSLAWVCDDGNTPGVWRYLLNFFSVGREQIAWRPRIRWAIEVPSGPQLPRVLIACEACRGTRQGQRDMGRATSLVEPVRLQIWYRWFWSDGHQEDPQGWDWWAHARLPSAAKQVRFSLSSSTPLL